MTTPRTSPRFPRSRRLAVVSVAVIAAFAVGIGPAAAHAEVTASNPQALAKDVTLSFTSEAESDAAGIKELRIVLPKGIAPDAVELKEAPKGWKMKTTADGYTVGGEKLATGTDAEHSITVEQLPDAKSLAFKTVETYSDGKISRWIELRRDGEKEPESPAPVLELKPAAAGAKPDKPSSSPETKAPAPAGKPSRAGQAQEEDPGISTGVGLSVAALIVVLAAGYTFWWLRRRRDSS